MFQAFPPLVGVVRHLIILNVLMFFGTHVIMGEPQWQKGEFGDEILSLGRLQLAAYMPGSEFFQPYQILTYMFMHGDIGHLFFNMLSVYFFAPAVESVWGTQRFLFYYLACGVGAYLLYFGVQWWELSQMGVSPTDWNAPMLGASGAVFGIYAAFAMLFPNQIIQLMFPPIALKAKYFVGLMAAFELYYGVRSYNDGVAHYAHLGGALFGVVIILMWNNSRRRS